MNKQEAKERLSAYLQSSEAELDEQMQEALEMAESDPELQEWMQLQAEMDPQLREAFDQTPVPDDLEAALLETVRAAPVAAPARFFSRNLLWAFGAAAAVILGLGSFFYVRQNEVLIQDIQQSITGKSPDDFGNFRDGMAYYVRNVYFQLDHLTEDLTSIESWLDNKEAPVYEGLPAGLTALVPIGCKQLTWQDQNVSLVCFHTADGKIVHLFILNRQGIDASLYEDITAVANSQSLETGGWMTGSTVYLLVGSDPQVDIEFALG
ncbi:DUF3379 domain-containing protein [Puniceicoccales bacterium CK1056]|uniref:DUF3379 domain-containing protein n=1 Tax=Oceanipulchritudo coccoides TaxID=2706888 RepID=A0A6B2M2R9_9BACT|nr:DUF3379 domain-containing protein [Oceanipulchritudo coccoides]NDV62612.1 DUF3379 domain-containing protein [Oceanipulchritudo coccoides]